MIKVIRELSDSRIEIENVSIYRNTLEDVFMKLTGKSINEQ